MARIALYPGTFDPVTNGHVESARRLGAGRQGRRGDRRQSGKSPMFSLAERQKMIAAMIKALAEEGRMRGSSVTTFEGLAVEAARKAGATIIVRGLRDATDFDYEMQMAGMNAGDGAGAAARSFCRPRRRSATSPPRSSARSLALGGDVDAVRARRGRPKMIAGRR